MISKCNYSITEKILNLKLNFLRSECIDINKWSFLEEAIKELIQYYIYFNKKHLINLLLNYEVSKKIININNNFNKTNLNFDDIKKIIKFFKIEEINEKDLKILNDIYMNRNKNAHTNNPISSINFQIIFYIVNLLNNKILKLIDNKFTNE